MYVFICVLYSIYLYLYFICTVVSVSVRYWSPVQVLYYLPEAKIPGTYGYCTGKMVVLGMIWIWPNYFLVLGSVMVLYIGVLVIPCVENVPFGLMY